MKYSQAILNKNGLLQKEPGGKQWEIKDEFIWYVNYKTKLSYIIIPKGFKTDFGSIPKFIQNIFSPTKYVGYILHDYLYVSSSKIMISNNGETFDKEISKLRVSFEYKDKEKIYAYPNRKFADKVLKEAIKVEGAGVIERNLIYIAVRLFGFLYFKND